MGEEARRESVEQDSKGYQVRSLIALVLLSACAVQGHPLVLSVSLDVPRRDKDALFKAATEINSRLGCTAVFLGESPHILHPFYDGTSSLTFSNQLEAFLVLYNRKAVGLAREWVGGEKDIILWDYSRDAIDDKELNGRILRLFAHEAGHTFGLDHFPGGADIMSKEDDYVAVSEEEWERWLAVLKQHNPCGGGR